MPQFKLNTGYPKSSNVEFNKSMTNLKFTDRHNWKLIGSDSKVYLEKFKISTQKFAFRAKKFQFETLF